MKTFRFKKNPLYIQGYICVSDATLEDLSGTYVLASEAEAEIAQVKVDWLERCKKFRKKDADEAAERERVLVDALEEISNHVNENSRIGVVIRAALAAKGG